MKINISSSGSFDPNKLSKMIKDKALHTPFDTECPKCHRQVKVKLGHNVCPYCGTSIDVEKGQGWD